MPAGMFHNVTACSILVFDKASNLCTVFITWISFSWSFCQCRFEQTNPVCTSVWWHIWIFSQSNSYFLSMGWCGVLGTKWLMVKVNLLWIIQVRMLLHVMFKCCATLDRISLLDPEWCFCYVSQFPEKTKTWECHVPESFSTPHFSL